MAKTDVWQGTLALMVLKTLQTLGLLHGYDIARRIEQTSGDLLSVTYGTLYPTLLSCRRRATSRPSGVCPRTAGIRASRPHHSPQCRAVVRDCWREHGFPGADLHAQHEVRVPMSMTRLFADMVRAS